MSDEPEPNPPVDGGECPNCGTTLIGLTQSELSVHEQGRCTGLPRGTRMNWSITDGSNETVTTSTPFFRW